MPTYMDVSRQDVIDVCVREREKREKERDTLQFLGGKLKARQGTYCKMDVVSLLAVGRKDRSPAQATCIDDIDAAAG